LEDEKATKKHNLQLKDRTSLQWPPNLALRCRQFRMPKVETMQRVLISMTTKIVVNCARQVLRAKYLHIHESMDEREQFRPQQLAPVSSADDFEQLICSWFLPLVKP
jgi:hypothetical protein